MLLCARAIAARLPLAALPLAALPLAALPLRCSRPPPSRASDRGHTPDPWLAGLGCRWHLIHYTRAHERQFAT
ncbi:MAG TPA: hypothetical protein PKA24_19905, partial [Microthrixaceae bacterium]|nr:hypothetical protein [Microthrixaceae bacterium]